MSYRLGVDVGGFVIMVFVICFPRGLASFRMSKTTLNWPSYVRSSAATF